MLSKLLKRGMATSFQNWKTAVAEMQHERELSGSFEDTPDKRSAERARRKAQHRQAEKPPRDQGQVTCGMSAGQLVTIACECPRRIVEYRERVAQARR